MHTTAMVNDNLVLLAGDYDARLASRNIELVDLETLESTEITVRDYHPGPRFFLTNENYNIPFLIIFFKILKKWLRQHQFQSAITKNKSLKPQQFNLQFHM